MSCVVDNNAFEVIITPSRKRKRDSGRLELPSSDTPTNTTHHKASAFSNAAFSSTPKKEIQSIIQKFNRFPPSKRRPLGKENGSRLVTTDACLEVKSIVDLVNQNVVAEAGNPFEVIRKPPKKKKKADLEEACFINTGLNLDIPEKQFNPFEVKRESPAKLVRATEPQCFVNPALNIRTQETTAARNPFEIQRNNPIFENTSNGIENPGLDLANAPLRIGIPFKPTTACRIDFKNLTPSKMLAEKLVFSPMNPKTPRVLADISEEDTTMDIGKELDLYQLELENSINEAKQRKTIKSDGRTFSEKLEDIEENSQEEQEESESQEPKTPEVPNVKLIIENNQGTLRLEDVDTPPIQKTSDQEMTTLAVNKTYVKDPVLNESFTDDEGIDYDDTEDDDVAVDFKAPAPFVRAYRRPDPIPPSPLSIENNIDTFKKESKDAIAAGAETKSTMKSIRNSIRKLIHSNKGSSEDKMEKKPLTSSECHSPGNHFMETIRHSLRRKPQKEASDTPFTEPSAREVSIIDTSERKMKFKSNINQRDYIKMEDLTSERKTSLRSSLRKSTRDVKNQIMKSVFHKNIEEYNFSK
ncbi:uncharacterized protein LOC129920184 [Episyrphus balteatus]|uniref:uncharacterized protein LOC129920184 n=1 Tax=Episyrphus balteatus TaxID=286459 RepID=UPI0024861C77|nr:uncharacterized protein LOC129920184 [Episyrphus balteatus]